MKKHLYKFIIFFLSGILLISCDDFFETNIEIDPPKFEKKIAITAKATTGDNDLLLKINESIGVLENDSLLVGKSGAVIIATLNGVKLLVSEILMDEFGKKVPRYSLTFPQKLKGGDVIKIEAKYKDLPIATVESRVPLTPIFSKLAFTKDAGKNGNGDDISKLTFNYKSQEADIYLAGYFEKRNINCSSAQNKDGVFTCLKYDTSSYQQNISIQDPDAAYEYYLKKSNSEQTDKALTVTFSRSLFDIALPDNARQNLYFETYNKEGYEYLISATNYNNNIDNPFATPVNVSSNVKNGYGILLLSNSIRIEL